MYYVNREQIDRRLAYMQQLCDAAQTIADTGINVATDLEADRIARLATERIVHLAAECVTDIGSYMIDGYVMRDASSYEDIVQILHDEKVFDEELFPYLRSLVQMRKPLVQEYDRPDLKQLAALAGQMPDRLGRFADCVIRYLA